MISAYVLLKRAVKLNVHAWRHDRTVCAECGFHRECGGTGLRLAAFFCRRGAEGIRLCIAYHREDDGSGSVRFSVSLPLSLLVQRITEQRIPALISPSRSIQSLVLHDLSEALVNGGGKAVSTLSLKWC